LIKKVKNLIFKNSDGKIKKRSIREDNFNSLNDFYGMNKGPALHLKNTGRESTGTGDLYLTKIKGRAGIANCVKTARSEA
jgi:hypothetical protein